MNNEEKILEMLSKMQGDITGIKETLEEVDQRSIRTQVLLETDITDRLQLLYDGHALLKEKMEELVSKSRIEEIETDIDLLKHAFKLMQQDIAELKKAQ